MYSYELRKKVVFTDLGQRCFLEVRDFALKAWQECGAITAGRLLQKAKLDGDSWDAMAVVDRLIELGEARVIDDGPDCPWQHRIFVSTGKIK